MPTITVARGSPPFIYVFPLCPMSSRALGDLLEWIANAKPEDAQAIRGEIRRLYADAGDTQGAAALNQALSDVLENQDTQTRQWVLDDYEIYTRADPAEVGQFGRDLVTRALLAPLFGGTSVGAPTAEAGATAEVGAASDVWSLGWAARGQAIEKSTRATSPEGLDLADNFPVIDHATEDAITSIKSIDLNAVTYQQPEILARRIEQYVNDVANFTTRAWGGVEVAVTENTQRELIIAVPKGSVSLAQQEVVDSAIMRAQNRVHVRIVPF